MSESNLLEKLRDMADPKRVGNHFHPLYGEAADEIENVHTKAWKYLQECGVQARRAISAEAERDALRAERDKLSLQVLTLTNERDEARALGRLA